MQIEITMKVAGALYLQYFPHVMGCPDLAESDVPTTFAEAPTGVVLPPMSVPSARVHASVSRGTPAVAAMA